jgi:protein-L-isoaspartate(D-aspartate) O-methyltransferase
MIKVMGWLIPPPKRPTKTKKDFLKERIEKVEWLVKQGFLRSERIRRAMLKVPREEFVLLEYKDYAYHGTTFDLEVPLPIPGREATISCPHSYPLFYEALKLKEDEKFLEVGTGSGYGAALAREIVGNKGKVVSIEIDEETFKFAKENLGRVGYTDILLVHGDGALGYEKEAPYDKISVTAACPEIPKPLIKQLKPKGRLVSPVVSSYFEDQDLILLEKQTDGTLKTRPIGKVLYVPLKRTRY